MIDKKKVPESLQGESKKADNSPTTLYTVVKQGRSLLTSVQVPKTLCTSSEQYKTQIGVAGTPFIPQFSFVFLFADMTVVVFADGSGARYGR